MKRFICVSGPDGVGKSTLVKEFHRDLAEGEVRARLVWFRWPIFLSAPLVAYARARNFYDAKGDTSVSPTRCGTRAFWRSHLLAILFPWTQLIDAALFAAFKVWIPRRLGSNVICDRFLCDVLVDALVATGRDFQAKGLLERSFLALLSYGNPQVVILDASWDVVQHRRSDDENRERWERTRDTYLAVAKAMGFPVLDNCDNLAISLVNFRRGLNDVIS